MAIGNADRGKHTGAHATIPRVHRGALVLTIALTLVAAAVCDVAAAVIPVTTTYQAIGSGACSLQEAIYSANFDNNVAIRSYAGSTPVEVVTKCVPGNGDDIIVLPAPSVLRFNTIVDDASNPTGPAATPMITSKITILAYGAILERDVHTTTNFRLFAVGPTGHLTIRRAYIRGFRVKGGEGGPGGGGGMGAGGAIYVMGGTLVIEGSTFERNEAYGGLGESGLGGGGGGIGGNGGKRMRECYGLGLAVGGTGGGGARGAGGQCLAGQGGGGGGTISAGHFYDPGFACGGAGGDYELIGGNGESGRCPGGGGGGGAADAISGLFGTDGGSGHYGGGGGGGAQSAGTPGGDGGFGGGGGAAGSTALFGGSGGDGGFGAGGGGALHGEITSADLGNGGFFAGDGGSASAGGGGAGLGGAIFNDSGTVLIQNSTLTANAVGGGYSEYSQDGSGGGGALFSRNGHLSVLNSTISGNLANFGGGIILVQDSESAPTSFILQNTIVADNGQYECAISGFSIAAAFAGNLIQSNAVDDVEYHRERFIGCGGVVMTGDPGLGPLQLNQGVTPTMAIGSTSPAWNAADPATSLVVDQRRQDRPAMGAYDIGAFELCLEGIGKLQHPCPVIVGAEIPGQSPVQLTVQVQPAGGGTTTPATGTTEVLQDTVIALTATPNAGYRFVEWSNNVTESGSPATTVFMNGSQTVTATFAGCACAKDVTSAMQITLGGMTRTKKRHVQMVTLKNNSLNTISGPISLVLDRLTASVTLLNASGATDLMLPAGSPYVNTRVSLAPGQSVAIQLQFNNPGSADIQYDARVLAGAGTR